MVTEKATPAVWGLEIVAKVKWSKAPATTLKLLEVPDLSLAETVMVLFVLDFVMVTLWDIVPLVKNPDVVGVMVPVKSWMLTVPVKLVTVLL